MVFRPDSYNFPPSRGRQSFDLKADGSLIRTGIGPTDRTQQSQGHWKLEDGEKLEFYTGSDPAPSRVMEIAEADKDRLVVKK
jgi:hypothetical protein